MGKRAGLSVFTPQSISQLEFRVYSLHHSILIVHFSYLSSIFQNPALSSSGLADSMRNRVERGRRNNTAKDVLTWDPSINQSTCNYARKHCNKSFRFANNTKWLPSYAEC